MSRGPAVTATIVALALFNIGLASIIVSAIGERSFAPLWLGVALLVLGLAAAVYALILWRDYLSSLRAR